MAHSALRLRAGALVAAGALTLGGLVAASPAAAEPIEPFQPTIELSQTSFPAGDWQDGFTLTGSGFDPSIPTADFYIGASGENGGGVIYDATVEVADDGTIDTVIVPDRPTQAPDANGYPKYSATVSQVVGEGEDAVWNNSNAVPITITEGVTLVLPAQPSPEQVTAGLAAEFTGFGADEPIAYSVVLERYLQDEQRVELIAEDEGLVNADASGAGSLTVALAGAQEGDYLILSLTGTESNRIAEAFANVTAAVPAPAPAPVDPAPAAPAGDRLPDTGVDLGIGITALALLAFGAGALLVTRRTRASLQR